MTYRHGVFVNEVPAAVPPPVRLSAMPVVFGTAPVNLSKRSTAPINEPVLCNSYGEAIAAFGFSNDFSSYTLSEFIYSQFVLYGLGPVVLINVLDPATHKSSVAAAPHAVSSGSASIKVQGILLPSVAVKSADGETTYVLNTDYELAYDKDGNLVINIVSGGAAAAATSLSVAYDKLNPAAVDADDIIGGIVNDQPTGMELINQVFPRFQQVPGLILAPGFSHNPTVAAVMTAKAESINGLFQAMAITDLDPSEKYTDVAAWKEDNGYESSLQINTYPLLTYKGRTYRTSTHLAGAIGRTDIANGNIPFVSPSNQKFVADGAVLADGSPLFLGPDTAQVLNGGGIVTALNFIGGWKAWGNRTGIYPKNTVPKDSFIPVRRMMNWINNQIILSYWERVDGPITRRLTEAVVDSLNIWLNGLTAQGVILGGRVAFLAEENSEESLADGKVRFHVYQTPPSPAEEIEFITEYDAQYMSAIFG